MCTFRKYIYVSELEHISKGYLIKIKWISSQNYCFCACNESIKHFFFYCYHAKTIWDIVHVAASRLVRASPVMLPIPPPIPCLSSGGSKIHSSRLPILPNRFVGYPNSPLPIPIGLRALPKSSPQLIPCEAVPALTTFLPGTTSPSNAAWSGGSSCPSTTSHGDMSCPRVAFPEARVALPDGATSPGGRASPVGATCPAAFSSRNTSLVGATGLSSLPSAAGASWHEPLARCSPPTAP
jgi:hypothetical protein